jgi:hypothetical protein
LFTAAAFYGRIFTYGGNNEDSESSAEVKRFTKDVYKPLKMWYNYNIKGTRNECEKLKTTVVERHGTQRCCVDNRFKMRSRRSLAA